MEIHKCNRTRNPNCKSDEEIERGLNQVYFTFYTIQEREVFVVPEQGEYTNHSHILTKDIFHSQFQLGLDKYIDNNNFFRIHSMRIKDHRFKVWTRPMTTTFLDFVKDPVWTGIKKTNHRNTTFDGVNYYPDYEYQILFGSYFFLSDDRVDHLLEAYNIVMILASLGGLSSLVFKRFKGFAAYYNKNYIMAE